MFELATCNCCYTDNIDNLSHIGSLVDTSPLQDARTAAKQAKEDAKKEKIKAARLAAKQKKIAAKEQKELDQAAEDAAKEQEKIDAKIAKKVRGRMCLHSIILPVSTLHFSLTLCP